MLTIGPASENLVVFSTIFADGGASASSGLGAVMGTKSLKAIAVKGTGKVAVADREKAGELRRHIKDIKNPPSIWPTMLPQERIKKIMCFGCIKGCMNILMGLSRQSFGVGKSSCPFTSTVQP